MARQGFDWAAIDLEHTEITMDKVADIFRGFKNTGTAPMARVVGKRHHGHPPRARLRRRQRHRPLVNNAEDARRRWPPPSIRPKASAATPSARPNEWGGDFDSAIKTANEEIAVIVMIESKGSGREYRRHPRRRRRGRHLHRTVRHGGSYGVPGQTSHPLVTEGCKKVLEACKRHHKAPACTTSSPTPKRPSEH